mmetsp:Transcript_11388/g.20476  ORF Transcript_11388/g.20476 Transcript_11388/m.20476 type:complete len:207 (+) Transcript_11388:280-900(+)
MHPAASALQPLVCCLGILKLETAAMPSPQSLTGDGECGPVHAQSSRFHPRYDLTQPSLNLNNEPQCLDITSLLIDSLELSLQRLQSIEARAEDGATNTAAPAALNIQSRTLAPHGSNDLPCEKSSDCHLQSHSCCELASVALLIKMTAILCLQCLGCTVPPFGKRCAENLDASALQEDLRIANSPVVICKSWHSTIKQIGEEQPRS